MSNRKGIQRELDMAMTSIDALSKTLVEYKDHVIKLVEANKLLKEQNTIEVLS